MTFLWRWRVLQPFSWSHSFQKTCLLSPYTPLFFIFFVTMVISLAQTLNSSHLVSHHKRVLICLLSLPRWLSGKEPNCQCRRCRFDPWVRKIPWRRKWQHTPVFLPGKSCGQRNLVGYSPWDRERVRHDLETKQQCFQGSFTSNYLCLTFLLLNNIPLYEYSSCCLSVHQLMDVWVVPLFGYYK